MALKWRAATRAPPFCISPTLKNFCTSCDIYTIFFVHPFKRVGFVRNFRHPMPECAPLIFSPRHNGAPSGFKPKHYKFFPNFFSRRILYLMTIVPAKVFFDSRANYTRYTNKRRYLLRQKYGTFCFFFAKV